MTDQNQAVPSTDYRIYLDLPTTVKNVRQAPDDYRLMMLFPDDPMDMPEGNLFNQQQWLYSDKEWLFYEDKAGDLVRAENTPDNQPGNWQKPELDKALTTAMQLVAHRINQSQRRLMGMADRGVPEPDAYSKEEDQLNSLVAQQQVLQRTKEALTRHVHMLHPLVIEDAASDLLDAIRTRVSEKAASRQPELLD